ncbi:porphobilinogen synthase [Desulfovibrio ferrophilus]|uniref:Delta-aminolevulinic acid dehydratase n=1 Tax=Desulfovibrio ferrophilus TaxID=241368 RepID=A0A2Z6AZH5_9BACT|nr:porphobilinogen synthase [Desulfovibrio ferrophilus]BBD08649.1 delta-aminolevulinic acid dehydratase [Desulfovibrio ferrophilus]
MDYPSFFRGRRLRKTQNLRDIVRENVVRSEDLIMPYFVVETDDPDFRKPISAMPGQFQLSLDQLEKQVAEGVALGMHSVILFGIPAKKDYKGSGAYAGDGIVQQATRRLKKAFPELIVITDTCLCEFTDHGHCGLVKQGDTTGEVHNDPTLKLLAKTAVSQAEAGADMVAPSDMMDGRVAAMRQALDANGYAHVPIMSYAVKYASAFYGPFREAAESTPQFGDRKTYQMDPANGREAMREAMADIDEGADILIVKPGMPYLDIVRTLHESFDLPVAAYQVSGEYSMIKAAADNGWIDGTAVMMESLTAFKRAGAKLIITYFTEDFLRLQSK